MILDFNVCALILCAFKLCVFLINLYLYNAMQAEKLIFDSVSGINL